MTFHDLVDTKKISGISFRDLNGGRDGPLDPLPAPPEGLALSATADAFASLERPAPGPVGVVMGSVSDWDTLEHAARTLESLGVAFEARVVSAHRTPELLFRYAETAEERGLQVIVAGAGGAAHLPGMLAAKTWLPVLGVPVRSQALSGIDSLLSIVQMPAGVPVGSLAIGRAGAINAALLATSILATRDPRLREALEHYRARQSESALARPLPRLEPSDRNDEAGR
jgi:5-(carboxyamino)imidazole ribonucleotide mutase